MKTGFWCFLIVFFILGVIQKGSAQNCDVLSKANDLIPDKFCAPVGVEWEVTYRGVQGNNIQFRYEWDYMDNGVPVIDIVDVPEVEPGVYTYSLAHTYPQGMDQCTYKPRVYLVVGGVVCTSSVMEQIVTVWDTDDFNGGNLTIEPLLYRICAGFGATVAFDDASDWNCTPPEENDIINDRGRWLQWVYGTDQSFPIPGISVNGNTDFPFEGDVVHFPAPVIGPDFQSEGITVPVTQQEDVGRYFQIMLHNWNVCNPYPDHDPRETTAHIVIVAPPEPDFQTRLHNVQGPVQESFCVGETIFFEDLTEEDPFNIFRWEFFSSTDPNQEPEFVSTERFPTYVYNEPGQKLIRLSVADGNAYGDCDIPIERTIYITPTAMASIGLSDGENDITENPELCLDDDLSASVTFIDLTPQDGVNENTRWRWELYDAEGELMESLPEGGGVHPEPGAAFADHPFDDFVRIYTQPGVYRVRLILGDDVTNCFTEDEVLIRILETPVAAFTNSTVCEGNPTDFFYGHTEGIDLFEWDFNYDGENFSAGATFEDGDLPVSYTFDQAGLHQVALRVRGAEGGCFNTIVQEVEVVSAALDVQIEASVLEGCSPLQVAFSNNTTGAAQHYWYYRIQGEEDVQSPSTLQEPVYTFINESEQTQIFEVIYQGTDEFGCEATEIVEITVYPAPAAMFTVEPDRQMWPGNIVEINNLTTGFNLTYFWDFGDGNTFDGADPGNHEYGDIGGYTIFLNVHNEYCESSYNQNVFIEPAEPQLEFSFSGGTGCRPLTVQFTNESEYADPLTYEWDFGDGMGRSSEANPVYTYYNPGTYTVTLRARNHFGVESEVVKQGAVEVYDFPVAAFQARPLLLELPDARLDLTNLSWRGEFFEWDFGDGNRSNDFEPVHVYQQEGTYRVTLIASNAAGCADTLSMKNEVMVRASGGIKIPNAFTPNTSGSTGGMVGSGGINDIFYPITEGVTEFNMQIFNRWGELIFESNSPDYGWDGYYQGRLCPAGVYVYKIRARFSNGLKEDRIGDVTLIR
jgi:gliding motility-associated-like protein